MLTSRREMITLAGGVAALGTRFPFALAQPSTAGTLRAAASQPSTPPTSKPDKAPPPPTAGPASAGQPVSETARAQDGKPVVPGRPPRKVRFALVGLGKLTVEEILPALKATSYCEATALVTADQDKGRAIARTLHLEDDRVFNYPDIARFASDDTIDAVYIATPNALHARDSVAASRAGKHVLCEKPLATTERDAQAMIDAAAQAGRLLMTAYRVHHEPINQRIRELIQQRHYGKPRLISFDATQDVGKAPQYRLDLKRSGGGSLFDIGIYPLNTICWLLGETPSEIAATQYNDPADERFKEVEQSIAFQLLFPSGCIANCTSSFGTARVNRYRIICEKGWFGMEPATSYRGLQGEHGTDEQRITLLKPESLNQFAAEFDHFARCILEGQPVDSPGEEGLRDIRLMQQIYQAARERQVVKVAI